MTQTKKQTMTKVRLYFYLFVKILKNRALMKEVNVCETNDIESE